MNKMTEPTQSALLGTYPRCDLAFVRGEGVHLFTQDGRAYLDFAAGIAVNALGHSDPDVVGVLKNQAEKLWHVSNMYKIPEQEALGQILVQHTFADSVFFTNSGTEAIECALKGARRYQYARGAAQKYKIIGFEGAFHGRSLGAIATAGNPKYTEGFGPMLDGFMHLVPDDLEAVEAAADDNVAAIVIEPIQGEGGVREIACDFLRGLRVLCDARDIVLIFDEVQCGVGRTGKLFAHEWAGISPDIMAVAKGIGGGFPLGACLFEKKIGEAMVPGTHGSTYGGNPLACAVGVAVMHKIIKPEFLARVDELGHYFAHQLQQLMQSHPHLVAQVRGRGLMRGLKLTFAPKDLVVKLRTLGLLTVGAGDKTLRLLPPLIVTQADIDRAVGMIDQALNEFEQTG